MINQELVDFCNYIQPVVNGCSGFIKSGGFMTHFPGTIIIMSEDETYCGIINVPVIYNIYMTARINTFLSLKTDEDKSNFNLLYFTGWNIKNQHLMDYYNIFNGIENRLQCRYFEPDCYQINGFENSVSKSSIGSIGISDGQLFYKIPSSKSITPLTKADTVSMSIYDCAYNPAIKEIKTVRFTIYKKKFKLTVDIFSNIIAV